MIAPFKPRNGNGLTHTPTSSAGALPPETHAAQPINSEAIVPLAQPDRVDGDPVQLTLDGHDPRIKLYRQRGYEVGSSDQWWAAKCADCGAPLSKFDFSEAECREIATAYFAKHQCPAAPLPPQ